MDFTTNNLIQGQKFVDLADFIYSIRIPGMDEYYNFPNTIDKDKIENFRVTPIIYTHTQYVKILFSFIGNFNKEMILITHNSDTNVDQNLYDCKPKNIIKWYSQNVAFKGPQIESIPIGLENDIWFGHLRKKDKIIAKSKETKNYQNWLYINHNITNNRKEREKPYELFQGKSWVKLVQGRNGANFDDYINNIYNHRFTLSPNGNGIDTHRFWEILYLNSIPIVTRNANTLSYQDLPICYVDDWQEITEEFLKSEFDRIKTSFWKMDKLKMSYWEKIIRGTK